MRIDVGRDYIETRVEQDPVTLRWMWRGWIEGECTSEMCDSEEQGTALALEWARSIAIERAVKWREVVALLGGGK